MTYTAAPLFSEVSAQRMATKSHENELKTLRGRIKDIAETVRLKEQEVGLMQVEMTRQITEAVDTAKKAYTGHESARAERDQYQKQLQEVKKRLTDAEDSKQSWMRKVREPLQLSGNL